MTRASRNRLFIACLFSLVLLQLSKDVNGAKVFKSKINAQLQTKDESTTIRPEAEIKCEDITIALCKDLPYNKTSFPNFLSHTTQEEAGLEAHQFFPLVKVRCSESLKPFLCSVYVPKCSSSLQQSMPSRNLCEEAKAGCGTLMSKFGFDWPRNLRCEQFPSEGFKPKDESTTIRPEAETKCEDITIALCKELPYNKTSFPNFLGHTTQKEVGLIIDTYFPLVRAKCSESLTPFLCSVYFPECSSSLQQSMPSRNLCEEAKAGCGTLMSKFGFDWPRNLRCEQFPSEGFIPKDESTTISEGFKPKDESTTIRPEAEIKCEDITIALCKDLPYNKTSFPNFLGHTTQEEAGLEAYKFFPLVKVRCSESLKPFLCSVYVPKCSSSLRQSMPSRNLCEEAKAGCGTLMSKFGFDWPRNLRCEQFPSEGFIPKDESTTISEGFKPKDESTTIRPEAEIKCEDITIALCKDLPYNKTSFPNFLGHTTQEEAGLEAHQFFPLVKVRCSESLKPFLCSVYVPKCSSSLRQSMPSRNLCEEAKAGCGTLMSKFGFDWPRNLRCEQFPSEGFIPKDESTTIRPEAEIKCEDITIALCKDLPYNKTSFPNFLGHTTQEEAGLEAYQFFPLVKVRCSESLKPFLCSVYVPKCSSSLQQSMPSRNLCEEAKAGCGPIFNMFGFDWPRNLRCEQFPSEGFIPKDERTTVSEGFKPKDESTTIRPEAEIKCEDITIALCKDLPYNKTSFPNFLGHTTQEEAGLEAYQFFPLVKVRCSESLKPFLCSVYVPKCSSSLRQSMPSRNLCEEAKAGCGTLMSKFGFDWPRNLRCEQFPSEGFIPKDESTTIRPEAEIKCEDITIALCKDLPYNKTSFPNFLGHTTQEEAGLEAYQFFPLVKVRCSESLKPFLCSVYVPKCSSSLQQSMPSRNLCEEAKAGCGPIFNRFGFDWPRNLRCEQFPSEGFIPKDESTTISEGFKPKDESTTIRPEAEIKCEDITIALCKDLPYNKTSFPNFLGHTTQEEAGLEAHQFFPLVKVRCSESLKPFLCSVYVPKCSSSLRQSMPSRNLCEEAKAGCGTLMSKFGFDWPRNLRCEQFPSEGFIPKDESTTIRPEAEIKCEDITIALCKDLPYNKTSFPNFLGHTTQEEAGLEAYQFFPLVKVGCSESLKPFLCSVYVPKCSSSLQQSMPSRNLCEEAKAGCGPIFNRFGFDWPRNLRCEQFPSEGFIPKDESTTISEGFKPKDESTTIRPEAEIKCEDITIALCKDLPYNKTSFPNFLGHTTQEEAGLEAYQFFPLVKVRCSESLKPFLCSVYVPKCSSSLQQSMPSRNLCEEAKAGCGPIFNRFGFDWPRNLRCEQFPSEGFIPKDKSTTISEGFKPKDESTTIRPEAEIKCEDITIALCKDLPYNKTSFPNFLGHTTQEDAGLEAHQFFPLVKVRCSESLKPFLCSVYVPKCSSSLQQSMPSRNLCEEAKAGCGTLMSKFGFDWPRNLRCEQFPSEGFIPKDESTTISEGFKPKDESTTIRPEAEIKCEDITIALCKDLPYNKTSFPNFLSHTTQEEAGLEAHQFFPLVKVRCSESLKPFLCSVYVPKCSSSLQQSMPSRNLCEEAKAGCGTLMSKFGFDWPRNLRCEQFPSEGFIPKDESTTISEGFKPKDESTTIRPEAEIKCEDITIALCKDLPYNKTSFPNFLGHTTQEEAGLEAYKFFPLVKVRCSESLKPFLCSVYVPKCSSSLQQSMPSRNLCEEAKAGCGPIFNRFGFVWPRNLRCEQFPSEGFIPKDKSTTISEGFKPKDESTTIRPEAEIKCEDITIALCKDLPYNKTSFPNFLGHTTQEEAGLEAHQFFPLVKVRCSESLKPFLCSVYVPKCSSSLRQSMPSRNLCEEAKAGCGTLMSKFGFDWPRNLRCEQFPSEGFIPKDESTTIRPEAEIKCEDITIALCKDLPYNKTSFPNFLGHTTQEEAGLEAYQFFPLVKVRCSESLKPFLCSVYVPKCSSSLQQSMPSRNLCEEAKAGCGPIFNRFGFDWPRNLRCEQFPSEGFIPKDKSTTISEGFKPKDESTTIRPEAEIKCEDITIALCKDLPYNKTSFPNFLGHTTQEEAGLEAHQFFPLVKVRCSESLKPFFCSVYVPKCSSSLQQSMPSRNLCEEAKAGCGTLMSKFGFDWPRNLRCEQFPSEGFIPKDKSTTISEGFKPKDESTTIRPEAEIKCEDITIALCKDLPYNKTSFPNFLGHTTQEEAGLEAYQFFPLVKVRCSESLKPFLCSVYVPKCSSSLRQSMPSRNLCEEAKAGCGTLMSKFGFDWPRNLRCEQFPSEGFIPKDESTTISEGFKPKDESTTIRPEAEIKCEDITIALCKDLPYNKTSFPNFLGHTTQEEAGLEAHLFFPLVKVRCSESLKPFLCSVYVPKCSKSGQLSRPSRSLCRKAKKDCKSLLNKFGFIWPHSLHCKEFPIESRITKDEKTTNIRSRFGDVNQYNCTKETKEEEEDKDEDNLTDCVQGDYHCRQATTRNYINGDTLCCFDKRLLSYKSTCDGDRGQRFSCKCMSNPMPPGQRSC